MPYTEKWEIEVGPVSSEEQDGFVDVRYSIRYPRGTFEVRQRVRSSPAGYAEAYGRVERMITAIPRENKELRAKIEALQRECDEREAQLQREYDEREAGESI